MDRKNTIEEMRNEGFELLERGKHLEGSALLDLSHELRIQIHKKKNDKKSKLYQDRDWLYNEYWNFKKSKIQIAQEQNTTEKTIRYWMEKLEIKSRLNSEAQHLLKINHVALIPKAIEFIDGELLGDGNLHSCSQWSALYQHSSKYKKYIEWLSNQLEQYGIKQTGEIYKRYHKECIYNGHYYSAHWSYFYASLSYTELLPLRQKWYRLYNPETDPPNWRHKYIKIVPRDIELTPLRCRQWYIGDGDLNHSINKISNDYIKLSTQGFPIADIEFLVYKLNKLGFQCHRTKNNTIRISSYSVSNFLTYIGPCPIDCYKYKWELKA
jgi:hypothetical protein